MVVQPSVTASFGLVPNVGVIRCGDSFVLALILHTGQTREARALNPPKKPTLCFYLWWIQHCVRFSFVDVRGVGCDAMLALVLVDAAHYTKKWL